MGQTGSTLQSRELGTFLRAHREHTRPEDLGVAAVGRRRTPGLRREELAGLAGIGVAWYTWLEQGRVTPSRHVLESLARVVKMGPRTTAHMLALAAARPSREHPSGRDHAEAVAFIARDWTRGPAIVLDRWFDIVAVNGAFERDWRERLPIDERHGRNWMGMLSHLDAVDRLTEGGSRALLRAHLPHFRAQTAAYAGTARVAEIYESLHDSAPALADWWTCQTMDGSMTVDFDIARDARRVPMRQIMLRYDGGVTVLLQHDRDPVT